MTRLLPIVAMIAVAGMARAGSYTAYSCAGVEPDVQQGQIDPELVRPWRELAKLPVDAWWLWLAHLAATSELPELSLAARVRLQHEVLVVAERLKGDSVPNTWSWRETRARMVELIHRLGPTQQELAALGAGSRPQLAGVLGPSEQIVERATSTCGSGNSIHVNFNRGLLAFRPLRSDKHRALVAQLVAIGRDGKPHVTPLVYSVEMRLGLDRRAPACVVSAGPDGVLRTEALATLERQLLFVYRQDKGVSCINCHHSDNNFGARDLDARELVKVDALRDAQVEGLMTEMWRRVAQSTR